MPTSSSRKCKETSADSSDAGGSGRRHKQPLTASSDVGGDTDVIFVTSDTPSLQLTGINNNEPATKKCKTTLSKEKQAFLDKYDIVKFSNEEIHDMQVKRWKAKAYKHFVMPPPIKETIDGDVNYQFKCKFDPSRVLSRVCHDTSTHNLNDHVHVCKAVNRKPEQNTIKDYVHGHSYSPGRFRYLLALWVSWPNHPFKIIHNAELREIFKMLYSKVDIIS
ncbi:hypothetical protein M422DRAFT_262567 [Sphaerobolus stellatus SS14]|uniref:Unplaced genomic scaffold SPHSTscaffold_116, whole genome shotgun sequence n=1 Tax=Sphaerobolus stellatus (strain SS14) TaxID=990650 RepID=A0A0C9VCU1_SPHS4|nr:hypothetical protein M422DRAFT_262567 [Sphaerobolus stellatus SS14]